jgi:hypothetical protein
LWSGRKTEGRTHLINERLPVLASDERNDATRVFGRPTMVLTVSFSSDSHHDITKSSLLQAYLAYTSATSFSYCISCPMVDHGVLIPARSDGRSLLCSPGLASLRRWASISIRLRVLEAIFLDGVVYHNVVAASRSMSWRQGQSVGQWLD